MLGAHYYRYLDTDRQCTWPLSIWQVERKNWVHHGHYQQLTIYFFHNDTARERIMLYCSRAWTAFPRSTQSPVSLSPTAAGWDDLLLQQPHTWWELNMSSRYNATDFWVFSVTVVKSWETVLVPDSENILFCLLFCLTVSRFLNI